MTTKIFDYSAHLCNNKKGNLLLFDFEKIIKRYFFLHLFFITLMITLVVLFFCFFSLIEQSYLLAVVVAFFFFSFAMYFVLQLYAKEQKPQAFIRLCQLYMASEHSYNPKNQAEKALNFAKQFDAVAPILYKLFFGFSLFKKISKPLCAYLFWQDVHLIKELFLLAMIDELKAAVKEEPINITAHKSLAEGYLMLSSHYKEPLERDESYLKGSPKTKAELLKKFQSACHLAIEEFSIVSEYLPDDPQIYKALARAWRDAQDTKQEIKAYEMVVRLDPGDHESLATLGILYFQQGMNVKGLHIYQQLQKQNSDAAQILIAYYGAYQPFDLYNSI